MKTNPSPMFLICVSVVMFVAVSCSKPTNDVPPATTNSSDMTADVSADKNETDESNQESEPSSKSMCETVTADDLKGITGTDYPQTTATADFTKIKHCEYRSEDLKSEISALIAFDAAASQRMEQNKQFPGAKDVADFEDEANWEPVRGTLTALSGNKCVEIRVSPDHGDEAARLKFAQAIATLVLERY